MQYLENLSDSFALALTLWPVASLVLTLPILAWLYHRHGRLKLRGIFSVYLSVLYLVSLITFTLYPLPDEPLQCCQIDTFAPQTRFFQVFQDIQDGQRFLLPQLFLNVVLFVPLGYILSRLTKRGLLWGVLGSLLISVFLETAQLTGLYGMYPCAYRVFDVDDIWANTLGGFIGAIFGALMRRLQPQNPAEIPVAHRPSFVRRVVTWCLDLALITALAVFGQGFFRLIGVTGNILGLDNQLFCWIIAFTVCQFVIPLASQKGQTIGGKITHSSVETKPRPEVRRVLFLLVRLIALMILFGLTFLWPSTWGWAIAIVFALITLIARTAPYDWW